MFIGVPKEIKTDEYRVGLTPATVRELTARGHRVAVETMAGAGAGIADQEYVAAGAEIVTSADQIFQRAELIVKVKEPLASERKQLRRGQIIFTYLHLAPDPEQTHDLMASGVTALAYETVTDAAGKLPLLAPMSRVAGCMAPQVAAHFLQRPQGGRGILLGRIEGRAIRRSRGSRRWGCRNQCGRDGDRHGRQCHRRRTQRRDTASPVAAVSANVSVLLRLMPGRSKPSAPPPTWSSEPPWSRAAAAPKLISARTVAAMKPGSVIVDVSIDQGGCAETSRPTTHSQPTFVVDGVVHYCVANMPGAVPRTSTFALDNATRPFVLALADKGFPRALIDDVHLRNGLNVHDGKITCRAVADALRLPYTPAVEVLR